MKWLVATILLVLVGTTQARADEIFSGIDPSAPSYSGTGPKPPGRDKIIGCDTRGCKEVNNPVRTSMVCKPNPNADPFPAGHAAVVANVLSLVPAAGQAALGVSVISNFGTRAAADNAACVRWSLPQAVGYAILAVVDAFVPASQLYEASQAKTSEERTRLTQRTVLGMIPGVGQVMMLKEMAESNQAPTVSAQPEPRTQNVRVAHAKPKHERAMAVTARPMAAPEWQATAYNAYKFVH